MTTGWPDEYYAVIFTTQRTDAEMAMYGLTSERMIELAQQRLEPKWLRTIFPPDALWLVELAPAVPVPSRRQGTPKAIPRLAWRCQGDKNVVPGLTWLGAARTSLQADLALLG